MKAQLILAPVLAQITLTLGVYILLSLAKAGAARRGEVNAERRGMYDDAWPVSVQKINNNIRNQFEVPVLFYVLCLALLALNAVSAFTLAVAWLFALSRVAHAYIHIYPNHVPTRRRVFMFGCVMVMALAVAVGMALVRA